MAATLEELLAEEGFQNRRTRMISRTSSVSDGKSSMPLLRGKHESGSSHAVKKVERARSDILRHHSKGESSSNGFKGRNPRSSRCRRGHDDPWDAKRFDIGPSLGSRDSEIAEVMPSNEIVEVGISSQYKDVYLNKIYGFEESNGSHLTRDKEWEKYRQGSGKNVLKDEKNWINSKHASPVLERKSSNDNHLKSLKQTEKSEEQKLDGNKSIKQPKLEQTLDTPALDEIALKAIVSILSEYVKRFLKDEDFRTSLRDNSFASLNFIGSEEGLNTESKVIGNLEQAIEIVERAAEESVTAKELKKASLQLSVITGLNSDDLKHGFTSGIPNLRLSACAHLYLSVIYVIQKKDRITAKHILQVFCNSPFQARTALLPDLWNRVFLPHLLHLKLWHDKETHSLADSPILINLKLLDKVYNEYMDLGTHRFAKYYKDWLSEEPEAPSLPVIKIPSFSGHLMTKRGLHCHTNTPVRYASPQPMVSKKLYDEVFRHSHSNAGFEIEVHGEENILVSSRSAVSPAPEDKQLISNEAVTCTNKNFEPHSHPLHGDLPVAKESYPESLSGETVLDENYRYGQCYQDDSHPIVSQPELEPPEGLEDDCEYNSEPSPFSIPNYFVCPLTGLLFEEPVTLETGQTFEREAITHWLSKGSMICPVTRKMLQCLIVPPANLVLKRVIDHWMANHYRHLFTLVSQTASNFEENLKITDDTILNILEQLFVVLSGTDRIVNAKRIISLGGLQLLLQRFHHGNDKEKKLILPLLLCCIEADANCRKDIARQINKSKILDLLHNEQLETIGDAALLLYELICLNRRSGAHTFLERLKDEELINAMDDLLIHLQTCPLEQIPLVAVLLLHLDLLSKLGVSDIYREHAINGLTVALERSLTDEKVQKKCSVALLVLGGFFSSSGKLMTQDWILKLAGFLNGSNWDIADDEDNDTSVDEGKITDTEDSEEKRAREKWLVSLTASLLEDGKNKFLGTLYKCLSLGNSDLVRVCLTTVAWLSSSIASFSDTEFRLYAFSTLISPLKKCMEHGELVEQRILASLCVHNFCKFPECRVLLMKFGKEIYSSLENLVEITWTAKELYAIISRQR